MMKKAIIQLEPLVCPSCTNKIEALVHKYNGVNHDSVKVLFNASKLKFTFNEDRISVEEVVNAITKLGYQVVKFDIKDV